MSERLEQWKARERLRSSLGCITVVIGFVGVACLLPWGNWHMRLGTRDVPCPRLVIVSMGLALLACAAGLWNARPWARWVAGAFVAVALASDFLALFSAEVRLGLVLDVWALVVLLRASTTRDFAHAGGARIAPATGEPD